MLKTRHQQLRKMKKNSTLFILLTFCMCFSISAQNLILSYNDFISNILANNPLAKKANNETELAKLKYKSARGNYDPLINVDYNEKQLGGKNYYSIFNGEIKQPIFTSQYLKVGYDYGVGNYVNPESYTAPSGLGYVGLEVGLLQGLLIDKRRAEVLKSKEYVNYHQAEKNSQLNNLLFESSLRYFDWLFSVKQMALSNYFLERAKERFKGLKALTDIGEKAPIDTIEAAILYQYRLLDLQSVVIENQKISNDINTVNWQNDNAVSIYNTYQPSDSLDDAFKKIIKQIANHNQQPEGSNPLLLKYKSLQEILKIDSRLKKEMIKPIVNVKYNFLSNNPTNDLNLSPNNYKLGFNVAFPLLLRSATNEYKMSKLQVNNNQLDFLNKTNELNFKLNALKQNINTLTEQINTASLNAKYSQQLVDAEKLKFNNGESTLFMLNTRENKWFESEIKLAEYKLKLIKTILSVVFINGNLEYKL